MKKIILASTSPRRKEILSKTRLPFSVEHSEYEEDMTLPLHPEELVRHLASGKAAAVSHKHPDALIIAADTVVAYKDKVLGKPKNEKDAIEILMSLSGQENHIITGVAIWNGVDGQKISFSGVTKVFMKDIQKEDILSYVATGEPMDKAGAYALQGLGSIFIERIEGDFFNAMGLPLARLVDELSKLGVYVLE